MRVVTSDLHEAIAAVSSVYCPHDVAILDSNRGIDAALEAFPGSRLQRVSLRYAAPVRIDATFENLLLFMTCADGSAEATQGRRAVRWSRGETLPFSPDLPSRLMFDRRFWQSSIRLDRTFVEEACARLINRPLDRPLCFELTPFSPALEQAWQRAAGALDVMRSLPTGTRTLQRFDEFIAALVLESHPHTYSELLQRETRASDPRLVREAERLMIAAGPDITVGEIAQQLRVSLRSLELGFREARNMTPTQAHREIRLRAAREALLNPTAATSVTSVATDFGFPHLARFAGYYRAMFDETPGATLRRRWGDRMKDSKNG